jgi:hypothetical protein
MSTHQYYPKIREVRLNIDLEAQILGLNFLLRKILER